jgi:hypothetical protein
VLALAVVDASVLLPALPARAATSFNPVAGSLGFQVFVNNSTTLQNAGSIFGTLANGGDFTLGPPNIAVNALATASTAAAGFPASNVTDLDPQTYWQGGTGNLSAANPQTLTVDLGAATTIGALEIKLPTTFPARTQTLSVLTSTDGTTFTTAVASATYSFVTTGTWRSAAVIFPSAVPTARYVRLNFTSNSAASDAQVGLLQVFRFRATSDRTFLIAYDPGTFNPNNEKEPSLPGHRRRRELALQRLRFVYEIAEGIHEGRCRGRDRLRRWHHDRAGRQHLQLRPDHLFRRQPDRPGLRERPHRLRVGVQHFP